MLLSNVLYHLGLAAVLFGAVRAADGRGGDRASELGVGAQHGVWFSRASWTEFANAWWELSPWMVLQNMGFSLAGTFINLITILTKVIAVGFYDGQS